MGGIFHFLMSAELALNIAVPQHPHFLREVSPMRSHYAPVEFQRWEKRLEGWPKRARPRDRGRSGVESQRRCGEARRASGVHREGST